MNKILVTLVLIFTSASFSMTQKECVSQMKGATDPDYFKMNSSDIAETCLCVAADNFKANEDDGIISQYLTCFMARAKKDKPAKANPRMSYP